MIHEMAMFFSRFTALPSEPFRFAKKKPQNTSEPPFSRKFAIYSKPPKLKHLSIGGDFFHWKKKISKPL